MKKREEAALLEYVDTQTQGMKTGGVFKIETYTAKDLSHFALGAAAATGGRSRSSFGLALLSHQYLGAPRIHFYKRDRSKHATGGDIASGLDGVD